MKKNFLIFIFLLILLIGCAPSEDAENAKAALKQKPVVKTYIPPKDGKITEQQANKYILVAKDFNTAIMEQVEIMSDFYKKYGIAGKEEIDKIKDNKEAMTEWDKILNDWNIKEQEIYKKNNMSSDEFDWIASALIDEKNSEIQKKIAKALENKEDNTKNKDSVQ